MIFLVVWQCPFRSPLTDSSPLICRPFHDLFNLAEGYISPYYDQYAAPYVEIARPYTEKAHATFQSKVAAPVTEGTSRVYTTYLHPVVVENTEKLKVFADPVTSKLSEVYSTHFVPLKCKAVQYCSRYIVPAWDFSKTYLYRFHAYVLTPAYYKISYYTWTLVNYAKAHILPKAKHYASIIWDLLTTYVKLAWNWLVGIVSPKVSGLYERAIEPQVNKIIDRIFQNTENLLMPSGSASGTSATPPDSGTTAAATVNASEVIATPEMSADTSSQVYNTEQTIQKATGGDRDAWESNPTPKIDITSELKNWKNRVNTTTKDAFDSFKGELATEKERLITGSRPKFAKLLQNLQKFQSEGIVDVRKLIKSMEEGLVKYDDEEAVNDEKDFPWTFDTNQANFAAFTENVNLAEKAVLDYAQTFLKSAVKRTEKIRSDTIDILDEFSDIALQEIGRKMVSDSDSDTSTASDGKATWGDWKEFRSLKEHLIKTRQDLVDYEIPMQDIRTVLQQVQQTASILATEASGYLAQLKGKADHLVMLKIKKEEARLIEQGKELPDQEPDYDIIYYEDLEEEDTKRQSSEEEVTKETLLNDEEDDDEDDDDEDGEDEDEDEGEDDEESETLTRTRTKFVTVTSSSASSPSPVKSSEQDEL